MGERKKPRVIHDTVFSGVGATVRTARVMREREATLEIRGVSENASTDWEKIPECRLALVIAELSRRFLDYGRRLGQRI